MYISDITNRLFEGSPSIRFNELTSLCDKTGIEIHGAMKTLEFELAKENVEVMLEVLEEVFPQAGVKLSKVVKKMENGQDKATSICLFIRTRDKYKGEIAQVLAKTLILRGKMEIMTILKYQSI